MYSVHVCPVEQVKYMFTLHVFLALFMKLVVHSYCLFYFHQKKHVAIRHTQAQEMVITTCLYRGPLGLQHTTVTLTMPLRL